MTSVNREIAAIADRLITDCTPACCSAARPSWSRLNEFRPAVYRIMVAVERRERPATTTPRVLTGVRRIPFVPPERLPRWPRRCRGVQRRPASASVRTPAGARILRPQPVRRRGQQVRRWLERRGRRAVRPRPVPAGRPAALDGPGAGTLRATALAHDVLERSAACRGRSARLNKLPPAGSTGFVPAGDRRDRRAGGSAPNAMKVLRVGRGNGPQQQGMA